MALKFCFLSTFFPPQHFGGDAVFLANLANALVADGHHVEVVHCADSFEVLRGNVAPSPFPVDPRVTVHTLRSPLGALSPLLTYATGRPLLKSDRLRQILAQDFDVVHWHNLSLVGGPGALKYGKGVRLCTLHEYWFICPTHILFKFNEEACVERECFRCTLMHHRFPQPWRAGNYVRDNLQFVDRFLAPSKFVRDKYRGSALGIDPRVLPEFVPDRERLPKPNEVKPYFLFVGRLEKAKGLQTILPLFRKPGRRLLVAGSGNYEAELRQAAAELPQVEFLGRVPFASLSRLYAGATATLAPSICYETFGLTPLESLQQATPAIVSNFGALPEVAAETGGAMVYRNVTELDSLLDKFSTDSDFAHELGEKGYRSLERFSVRAHLKQYYAIIEEISTVN